MVANKMQNEEMTTVAAAAGYEDREAFDLRVFGSLLVANWATIIIFALVCLLLAGVYCFITSPVYESSGLVQVEEDKKSGSMSSISDLSSLFLGTPVETQAEIQLLQSHMVLGEVIKKRNLLVEAKPKYFPFIGAAIARLNAEATQPVSAMVGLRYYGWGGEQVDVSTLDVPRGLLGKTLILVAGKNNSFELFDPDHKKLCGGAIGEMVEGAIAGQDQPRPVRIFVRRLQAEPGTAFTITRWSEEDMYDFLTKRLTVVEQGKQSGVIKISFRALSAEMASGIVNDIENAYLLQNVERRSADAQQSLEFLQKQLPQLKEKIDVAQAQLNDYQVKHGSVDVSQETELVLRQAVDLDTQRLVTLQQRDEALQRFTPQHPVIKALDDQLHSIDEARGKLHEQSDRLPKTQQEILGLTRDLDVGTQLYMTMSNSIQELQVAKAGTIGNVRIVDAALVPQKAIHPKRSLILIFGLFAGLVGGALLVMAQRALIRGIDDPAELEQRLGLTTFAAIPYANNQKKLTRSASRAEAGVHVLAIQSPSDIAIEAVRGLRSSLHFALLEASNNIVMFTGPTPGLGKTFVTLNLACVLAQSGKTVVVVDADLRKGYIHKHFGAPANPGVSDYIAGDCKEDDIIRPSGVEGFCYVARGTSPPNPSELLLHERFVALIQELGRRFDYVLCDTPPVLPVADAVVIGTIAGSTILVLKAAEHTAREIEETLKRLRRSGIHVRGAVMNQMGGRRASYGYGNYRYTYYDYSGGD
jgi:tyrosine-protein kinase Etk/Wzc